MFHISQRKLLGSYALNKAEREIKLQVMTGMKYLVDEKSLDRSDMGIIGVLKRHDGKVTRRRK